MTNLSLTPEALKRWHQFFPSIQTRILENVWCCHCHQGVALSLDSMREENNDLILTGTCQICGNTASNSHFDFKPDF